MSPIVPLGVEAFEGLVQTTPDIAIERDGNYQVTKVEGITYRAPLLTLAEAYERMYGTPIPDAAWTHVEDFDRDPQAGTPDECDTAAERYAQLQADIAERRFR